MADRIGKAISFAYAMAKRLVLLPFRRKHVWLVCERGTDARDNGYHMFRYLRTQHPEIDAWYIITRDSADYDKVAQYGNVVIAGSLKHWILYISSEKILTAFEPHFCPSKSYAFYRYVKRKNHQIEVFLQHGVIANDFPIYHRDRSLLDIFICGAKPEYDFISSTFGYKNGEVRYTGLARFDALHDVKTKRQILIMPTYRKWFRDQTEKEVSESRYVRLWNSFINNPRLAEAAEKNDVDVIFYPHQLMQQHVSMFTSSNPRIIVADYLHYDVQPLLKESLMLISDYSSVQFDFAYMGKPQLYYQFDEAEVFSRHYGRGYFDYRETGFGEVVTTEEELLETVVEYLGNGCELKPFYRSRIEGFFPLHDTHNCERIFREITK